VLFAVMIALLAKGMVLPSAGNPIYDKRL